MSIHNPGTKVQIYSPIWNTEELTLPRDRATVNAWARSLYAIDIDINRLINQHALLLTSIYEVKDGTSETNNTFCKDQLYDLQIPNLLEIMIREYFVIGELFLHLTLDEKKNKWKNVYIQNPDYILIKHSFDKEEEIFLRPDENLRRICLSKKEEDIKLCKSFPTEVVKSVRDGKNIATEPYYFWHMLHKLSPYDARGNSFLMPLFRMANYPICPERTDAIKKVLIDITDLSGNLKKEVLYTRYLFIIDRLEYWFNKKMLAPIAKLNDLGQDLPQIKFNKNKLRDILV